MDDAASVSRVEGVTDFDGVAEGFVDWQGRVFGSGLPLQPPRQRFAFQVLHHQEVDIVLMPHVVEDADVWMFQRGDRLRLALEPLVKLGVVFQVLGQDLDRDAAVQARVAGLVDLAHAAGAERRHNLVRAEVRSGIEGQGWSTGAADVNGRRGERARTERLAGC